MKKCVALFILLSGSMLWATLPNIKYRCNALFISHLYCRGMQGRPSFEYVYRMAGTRVIQKVEGGYLITIAPEFMAEDCGGNAVAFIYTDRNFAENSSIPGWAYYAGQYQYESVNGFPKSIIAMRLYKGNPDGLEARGEPKREMRPVKMEPDSTP